MKLFKRIEMYLFQRRCYKSLVKVHEEFKKKGIRAYKDEEI